MREYLFGLLTTVAGMGILQLFLKFFSKKPVLSDGVDSKKVMFLEDKNKEEVKSILANNPPIRTREEALEEINRRASFN